MSHFWDIYENLEESVYVSNVKTNEIVYMNKIQRKTFGYEDTSYIGKKCYEVFHNEKQVCSFCNGKKLSPGEFVQWEFYNPLVGKYYRILNTLHEEDNVLYRLEIMLDITGAKQTAEELNKTHQLEGIANAGMRAGLKDDNPEHGLQNVLAYIGEVLKAERAYIFERRENKFNDNTYEWCAPGVDPQIHNLQNIDSSVGVLWYDAFEKENQVIIHDIEEIKESDPSMYSFLEPQGIKSLIVVPLRDGDKVIGFYGIDNPPMNLVSINSNVLEMLSTFTVLLLRKRSLYRKLHIQSKTDYLTGAGNRYAMYEYMEEIKDHKDLGVVYCDLTGLKKVNDEQGHAEGDQLLRKTCVCLKKVFDDKQIFRTGGDEFVVLTKGISEEELIDKTKLLEIELKLANVNVAIGHHWTNEKPMDIDTLCAPAEKRMYQKKAEWYKQAGIDRRK